MAVLAAGEADHDAIAFLDQPEIGDRLARLPADALGELVALVAGFTRIAHERPRYRYSERPPSTARTWPVMKGAVARKCTASAISSGEPRRASGVPATMRSRSRGSNWPSSGQAIAPGEIALTRTSGASSSASARVSAASPAFATL